MKSGQRSENLKIMGGFCFQGKGCSVVKHLSYMNVSFYSSIMFEQTLSKIKV